MKIYEIGTGYTPIPARMGAATEIVVEELTKSFIKKNRDATIVDIASQDRPNTNLPIIEVKIPKCFMGTDVHLGMMHKIKRVIYSIGLALTLKKMISLNGEHVTIHFHNQYNMFFFLKLVPEKNRKRCFIAYTNHSYIWHSDWNEIKDIVSRRYFQEIESMKKADRVFVLNSTTKNTLVNHLSIDESKVTLIDNGVNTDIYSPLPLEEIEEKKEKLKIQGKKVFLQIGSVCDRKNQLGAVELLLPILKESKDIVFMYAGGIVDQEYQQKIIEYIENNNLTDQVKYLGEIKPGKELNEYYNLSEAMIFPSKSEGFSLVIIEAMSAGVPVIINKALQFGLADACYQYTNQEDFCQIAKNEILNIQKRKLAGERVRKIVADNYSWDKIADDYYNLWR